MSGIHLSEGRVRSIVIAVSIVGMIVLLIIGSLSETPLIGIDEAGGYEGERVRIEGQVVGIDPMEGDSSSILLYGSGGTIEVLLEDVMSKDLIGDVIIVEGDVIKMNGEPCISSSNSDTIDRRKRLSISEMEQDPIPGEHVWMRGIVVSSSYIGDDTDSIKISMITDHGSWDLQIEALVRSNDDDARIGDVVNLSGIISDEKELLCYGDGSMVILSRGAPSSISLTKLLLDMEEEGVPNILHPVNVQGYLRYEPTDYSFYISDVPEGSKVSIKVSIESSGLHKGDLVSLVNCTILWDEAYMRYFLSPESIDIVTEYGPWRIGLGNLEHGLSGFEDSMVSIDGFLEIINGSVYLTDGIGFLGIRGFDGLSIGSTVSLAGIIRYDNRMNVYFLEGTGKGSI